MQNPDFAYTGVCLTLRVREMSRDPNAKVSDSVLKALGIALSRLRTRLASAEKAIDDVSITAVSFMAATAVSLPLAGRTSTAAFLTTRPEGHWGSGLSSKTQRRVEVYGSSPGRT
jgi:hypothetical protein